MTAASYIYLPYSNKPSTITVRQVVSSASSATSTKEVWQCTYTAASGSLTCACNTNAYTVPANLLVTNDSVIVGQANYDYKPLVFNYFLKKALGSNSDGGGGYIFSEIAYSKPRGAAPLLMQANGLPCPNPTFP
jgi:hypothetical protein